MTSVVKTTVIVNLFNLTLLIKKHRFSWLVSMSLQPSKDWWASFLGCCIIHVIPKKPTLLPALIGY